MWDYDENLDDDDYFYTKEDDIEGGEEVDSEMEALMYANIHYQGDFTTAEEKNELLAAELTRNTEKKKKKVKIVKSVKKMSKKTSGVDKLTQFVSVVKHNPTSGSRGSGSSSRIPGSSSRRPGSSSVVDIASTTDSDVKVVDIVKPIKKICTKAKGKAVVDVFTSDSDSDSFFGADDDARIDLPTDININIDTTPLCKNRGICGKKRKIVTDSDPTRKIATNSGQTRKISKSGDFLTDYEEKMRKFYDSESSEGEIDVGKSTTGDGGWKISNDDRFGWISDKKRFFGGGFNARVKMKCRNCQQWGHGERDCQEKIRISHCRLCGETDHKVDDCLNMLCARCESAGHHVSTCQISSAELRKRCKRCRVKGHTRANCPDLWRRYHLTINEGPIVRGSSEANPRVFCFNCGKKGHLGHKCPYPMMKPSIQPTKPFVISYEGRKRLTIDDDQRQELLDASNNTWKQIIDDQKDRRRCHKRKKWTNHEKHDEFPRNEAAPPKNTKRRSRNANKNRKLEETNADQPPPPKKTKKRRDKTPATLATPDDSTHLKEVDFFRMAVTKLKRKVKRKEEQGRAG